MKFTHFKYGILGTLTGLLAVCSVGCSGGSGGGSVASQASTSAPVTPAAIPVYSTSVPSADAITGRILKGIPSVSPMAGNFKNALGQFASSLPQTTNPTKAGGLDKIPLIAFAACSDVTSSTLSSTYNINVGGSLSSNTNSLIAAGVQMVNAYVGNLAAQGTALNTQVTSVFSQLVANDASAGASTSSAFISVCMAATSFGVTGLGF